MKSHSNMFPRTATDVTDRILPGVKNRYPSPPLVRSHCRTVSALYGVQNSALNAVTHDDITVTTIEAYSTRRSAADRPTRFHRRHQSRRRRDSFNNTQTTRAYIVHGGDAEARPNRTIRHSLYYRRSILHALAVREVHSTALDRRAQGRRARRASR